MRLFAYRDPGTPASARYGAATAPFELQAPAGIRYGRLLEVGRVEIDGPAGRRTTGLDGLTAAPAIPSPGKIVCIGLNYRDHVEEQHIAMPERPTLFAKFSNAIIADGEPVIHPAGTHALDIEVELGVVIGATATRVSAAAAMAHVAGYVVCNDVTARDWQGQKPALRPGERGDGQWLRAKGSDTFLPVGPVFVSVDEVPDPHALRLRSWRIPGSGPDAGHDIAMQDGTTADMIWRIPELIEFVSAVITLDPGDLLITGTPAGVGVFRDPPVFLEPSDRVRVEVEAIGKVENPIVGPEALR